MEARSLQSWHASVYMDDYSFSAGTIEDIKLILGWTKHHCQVWGVELNERKSSILTNEYGKATVEGASIELAKDATYRLLGVETGWTATGDYLRDRFRHAASLVKRLECVTLPQYLYRKMVATFVMPVLFGMEFLQVQAGAKELDRTLRKGIWGTSRPSTNWPAAKTYCIQSHLLTAEGARYLQIFRSLWEFATEERSRTQCMRMWNGKLVRRKTGIWYSFLEAVADAKACLLPDGGVRLEESDELFMHLSQSKGSWMHGARQLWRRCNRIASHKSLPAVYPPVQEVVDWSSTRCMASMRNGMLDTIQANALNTKGRVARHYQGDCSRQCEHGCLGEDDFRHRLLECPAAAQLREELGITNTILQRLQLHGEWLAKAAIWTFSDHVKDEMIPFAASCGLWPSPTWLQSLIGASLQDKVHVIFTFEEWRDGHHPQLRQSAARCGVWGQDQLMLQARSLASTKQRHSWEVEALLLAAVIAIMKRCQVVLYGLTCQLWKLWDEVAGRRHANAHLSEMVLQARAMISVGNLEDEPDISTFMNNEQPKKHLYSVEVIEELEFMNDASNRMAKFCEKMSELYPMASLLSRNHGCWRGGDWLPLEPVSFCVLGRFAFALRLTLSVEEGSPFLLTFESLFLGQCSAMNGSSLPM